MSKTSNTLRLLRAYESPNVTYIKSDGSWPIVWERARGVHVWDAEGKRYLDLTAAFGVAAAGHANPRVVKAASRQMAKLLHAMGDVHPHALKAELARQLSRVTFERWSRHHPRRESRHEPFSANRLTGKTIFANSGFEAVEAALKTAILATGKPHVIAFHGAYHGVGYGALNATHRGQAQTAPATKPMSGKMHHGPMAKAGCTMKDGKMMTMMGGKMMPMTKDMTMSDGSVCKTDGTCAMKDGTTMTMKDGQCMMMNGKMTTMAEMHKSGKMTPGTKMGNMKM